MKLIPILFVLIFQQTLFAQNCSNNEFDFWVGSWKAEWTDAEGNNKEGKNIVRKILDGCVIEENFNGNPGAPFEGKSFSVFNVKKNHWQQTWVDNSGSYMIFEGGMNGGIMILSREIMKERKMIMQRMVFYNIDKDSFNWNWESSEDKGNNWKVNWMIKYKRLIE